MALFGITLKRHFSHLRIWGLVVAICLGAHPVWAAAPVPLEIQRVQVGLAGRFQVGSWTPVAVSVVASGNAPVPAKLVVIAADPDGQLVHTATAEQVLSPGQSQILHTRFMPGRMTGEFIVRVEAQGGGYVEQKVRPVITPAGESVVRAGFRQDVPFWGLSGVGVDAFKASETPIPNAESAPAVLVQIDEQTPELIPLAAADLPTDVADYASLDVLILVANAEVPGTSKSLLVQLTAQQQLAVREWVEVRGGHLVLSLGSRLAEFEKSELAQWLKLPLQAEAEIRQLDGLESFSPHPSELRVDGTVSSIRVGASAGNILARSLDGPLIVQQPYGFGRVSFIALNIDQPPLKNWDGLGHLLRKLLSTEREQVRGVRVKGAQLAKSTINDLASQMFASLEVFPQVVRLSLWSVMALLGVYILIIGPLDYLLVHRWLQRPHWTWITLSVWVFAGSALIIAVSNSLNGTQLRATQLEIVDLDQSSKLLRGQSWLTLYSPRTAKTAVELSSVVPTWSDSGKIETAPPLVSWAAPAENRVGGLYREGGVQLTQRDYHAIGSTSAAHHAGFSDYPLQVWSTGHLCGEWSGKTPELVESKLVSSGLGRLTGTVSHHLPVTLEDCLLAYANRVYFPIVRSKGAGRADLVPHFTWEIGGSQPVEQRDLRGFLTQVYMKEIRRDSSKTSPELLDMQTPYDPARRDQAYIIRMLTFHQAAGGRDYTGMRHDVLGNFDLSSHLRLGRAVLLGRLKKSSAEWKVDGTAVVAPDSQTFVRIVLPVDRAHEEEVKALPKID
ncbi:MAG: hypothetical protein JWN70_2919 [Planctomycetaceae bacterium]|nr:hypothetical protein [Planctomycetaceae bacterium]